MNSSAFWMPPAVLCLHLSYSFHNVKRRSAADGILACANILRKVPNACALPGAAAGCNPSAWHTQFARTGDEAGRIEQSSGWIAPGAVASLVFILVIGRGTMWTRQGCDAEVRCDKRKAGPLERRAARPNFDRAIVSKLAPCGYADRPARRRRMMKPAKSNPVPNRASVPGSGVGLGAVPLRESSNTSPHCDVITRNWSLLFSEIVDV